MSRFRLISFVRNKHTYYWIECRVLFFFWRDAGEQDFDHDELSEARERFIQVVANHGPKTVLAEM